MQYNGFPNDNKTMEASVEVSKVVEKRRDRVKNQESEVGEGGGTFTKLMAAKGDETAK
jgi:glutamate 5-kinase